MKSFIKRVLCIFGATVVMAHIVVIFLIQLPTKYSIISHEYNILAQSNRLDSIDGDKILIIGGSNCGFGIVSPMIEEALGKPVCNTGTHGGIGLKMQLALFENSVKPGDLVIVCPEYEQFFGKFYLGDAALIRTLATFRRDGYMKTDLRQWLHLYKFFPDALRCVVSSRNARMDSTEVYHVSSLNRQGDVTKYELRKHNDSLKVAIQHMKKLTGVKQESINLLKEFTEECSKKNAKVLIFPPVCDTIFYSKNREEIDWLWNQLRMYEIGVNGLPNDYALNDTLFYDSPYHPTGEGAIFRTKKLVKELIPLVSEDSEIKMED